MLSLTAKFVTAKPIGYVHTILKNLINIADNQLCSWRKFCET